MVPPHKMMEMPDDPRGLMKCLPWGLLTIALDSVSKYWVWRLFRLAARWALPASSDRLSGAGNKAELAKPQALCDILLLNSSPPFSSTCLVIVFIRGRCLSIFLSLKKMQSTGLLASCLGYSQSTGSYCSYFSFKKNWMKETPLHDLFALFHFTELSWGSQFLICVMTILCAFLHTHTHTPICFNITASLTFIFLSRVFSFFNFSAYQPHFPIGNLVYIHSHFFCVLRWPYLCLCLY